MIEAEKLCCPSCNATITSLTPSATYAKCEYCGAKFSVVNKKENIPVINEVPQKKLLIKYNREDFAKRILLDYFADEEDIPDDIYEEVQFTLIDLYILPYYYYDGSYTAHWNCQVGADYKGETVWSPQSGIASGKSSYIGLAYSGDEVGSKISDKYYNIIPACKEMSLDSLEKMDKPEIIEVEQNVFSLECDLEPAKVWELYVREKADQASKDAANKQIAKYSPTLHENITSSIQRDDKLTCYIHAPFWIAKIEYKEEEYYLGMFAYGSKIYGIPPCDQNRVAIVKEYKTKQENAKAIALCPLFLPICLFVVQLVWNLFWGIFNIDSLRIEFLGHLAKFIAVWGTCVLLPVGVGTYLYNMYIKHKLLKGSQENRRQSRDAVAAGGIEKYIQNAFSSALSQ